MRVSAFGACDVGIEDYGFCGVVPRCGYVGVAYGAVLVAYGVDVQRWTLYFRLSSEEVLCHDAACGAASDEHFVYFEGLEDVDKGYAVESHVDAVVAAVAHGAVYVDALGACVEAEVAHVDALRGYVDSGGCYLPGLVAEVYGAGVEVDASIKGECGCASGGYGAQERGEVDSAAQRYCACYAPVDARVDAVVGDAEVRG